MRADNPLLARLNNQEYVVVALHFGLGQFRPFTLGEIAVKCPLALQGGQVSRTRVGQILHRALRKMRHPALRPYLVATDEPERFLVGAILGTTEPGAEARWRRAARHLPTAL